MDRQEIIALKMRLSDIQRDIFNKIKPKVCVMCQKEISSTCESHSVPKFILKNISSNGKLYTSAKFINIPIVESTKGIKNAGVFRKICRTCDNNKFKEYETPENYEHDISNLMLYQISVKILLNNIYTREVSVNLILDGIKKLHNDDFFKVATLNYVKSHIDAEIMTIEEEKKKLNILLNSSPNKARYKVIFNYKLPYVVPYAFQDDIVLVSDMMGHAVNNIFSDDPRYRMQSLKICIFPLDTNTRIIIYRDIKDKRYGRFEKQFEKLALNEKLGVINYIVFLYSEKQFLSDKIDDKIFEGNICRFSRMVTQTSCYNDEEPYTKEFRMKYRLDAFYQCDNLLLERYAL